MSSRWVHADRLLDTGHEPTPDPSSPCGQRVTWLCGKSAGHDWHGPCPAGSDHEPLDTCHPHVPTRCTCGHAIKAVPPAPYCCEHAGGAHEPDGGACLIDGCRCYVLATTPTSAPEADRCHIPECDERPEDHYHPALPTVEALCVHWYPYARWTCARPADHPIHTGDKPIHRYRSATPAPAPERCAHDDPAGGPPCGLTRDEHSLMEDPSTGPTHPFTPGPSSPCGQRVTWLCGKSAGHDWHGPCPAGSDHEPLDTCHPHVPTRCTCGHPIEAVTRG